MYASPRSRKDSEVGIFSTSSLKVNMKNIMGTLYLSLTEQSVWNRKIRFECT